MGGTKDRPTGDRPRQVSARKRRFLKAFRYNANVSAAARAAGVARQTCYKWRKDDPEFAALMDEAEQESIDRLEERAFQLAYEGTTRMVVSAGKHLGDEVEYSEGMISMLLKARRPNVYKDRQSVEHSGEIRTIQDLLSEIRADRG